MPPSKGVGGATRKVVEKDDEWDGKFEFGGTLGVLSIMLFSHVIVYYFYACIFFYGANMVAPSLEMLNLIYEHASPNKEAVIAYSLFTLYELVLALVMPGITVQGLPLPSEGGKSLSYNCNAISCWYAILATTFALHMTDIYPIQRLSENYGPYLTVSVIAGNAVSVIIYIGGLMQKRAIRMSGNHIYDFFMGSWLNPRLFGGRVDLKMFAEIRNSWIILFLLTLSCAMRQYQTHGYITYSMLFMILAHFLYVNACQKGEECIPTTWDIFREKFGWMLIFWNFAGVPFSYCFQSLYIERILNGKEGFSSPMVAVVSFITLLAAYYVWDTANSQKNRFRMMRQGVSREVLRRKAFPQLPWGFLENPKTISSSRGELLCDGWWGYGRKIHYSADIVMAFLWGNACGYQHFIPFFYVCFFVSHLIHRVQRDEEKCQKKYGPLWDEFRQKVPYVFIPGIY